MGDRLHVHDIKYRVWVYFFRNLSLVDIQLNRHWPSSHGTRKRVPSARLGKNIDSRENKINMNREVGCPPTIKFSKRRTRNRLCASARRCNHIITYTASLGAFVSKYQLKNRSRRSRRHVY